MGRMKEEYMQMQEEMQYNLQPKESINQINNKVKKGKTPSNRTRKICG